MEGITLQPPPDDRSPRCPYCKQELKVIWVKADGWGVRGQTEILMCPHCESFLGYNAWKR